MSRAEGERMPSLRKRLLEGERGHRKAEQVGEIYAFSRLATTSRKAAVTA